MRTFLLLIVLLMAGSASAQLTITEIMYNPPEMGMDTLEYIEITNTSGSAINLEGYKLSNAVDFTFPNATLQANQAVAVAKSSNAISAVYGLSAYQWMEPGALTNTGEKIEIKSPSDVVIDEVNYAKIAPWPTTFPDGQGSSLVLCDVSSDNSNGANWTFALNNTGKIIGGRILRGSPGLVNTTACTADVTINATPNFIFSPKDITINVGQSVQWKNLGGGHNVNGSKTTFPNNPEGFSNGPPSSALWKFAHIFTLPGVYDFRCDPHASLGMVGKVTVEDNTQYQPFTISNATEVSNTGVMVNLGANVILEGTVYGINIRPNGLQFVIIDDQNNGIGVFSSSANFNYTVLEGDKVKITGTLEQFNGLAQIVPVGIDKLSANNPLVSPKTVTLFTEEDESSLIKVRNLNYVDITQWKGDGTSFNVSLSDGSNTFQIRIDNDVDLSKEPAPQAPMNVTGLLGQFDNTSPFTEGYQLLPRYIADIESASSTIDVGDQVTIAPNPTNGIIHFTTKKSGLSSVTVHDMHGNRVFETKGPQSNIDLTNVAKGVYYLQFNFLHGNSVLKVVKI